VGAGWLFTIGYLKLAFWSGALALLIWPYDIGVALAALRSLARSHFIRREMVSATRTELSSRRRRYLPRSTNSMSPQQRRDRRGDPARHDRNVESPEDEIETSIGAIGVAGGDQEKQQR